MSRKDRTKLGVTFFSVLKSVRKLKNDPNFENYSKTERAELVLEDILNKKLPEARADMPELDWTGILAFIIKILPLILMFF